MTIGAGFVCPDGVVLAADTKESFQDSHTYVNKIVVDRHILPNKMRPKTDAAYLAIAGSGTGTLVNHVINRIKPIFHENAAKDISAFRDALTKLMPQIYESPAFRNYPCSDSKLELMTQFIVVMRPDGAKASVFEIDSSLVDEVPHGITIIGQWTMRETADELQLMNLRMWDSTIAALYLISEAKRHYSSVGGVTHIYSIPHCGPTSHQPPEGEQTFDQGAKEILFGKLRQWHHELVMLAGSLVISEEDYKSRMAVFQEDHRRIREDFMEIENRDRERLDRAQAYRAKEMAKVLESIMKPREKGPEA